MVDRNKLIRLKRFKQFNKLIYYLTYFGVYVFSVIGSIYILFIEDMNLFARLYFILLIIIFSYFINRIINIINEPTNKNNSNQI